MSGTGGSASATRLDPAPCNALTDSPAGLLAPTVAVVTDPGLAVVAPAPGGCPQVWQISIDASWAQAPTLTFAHPLTGPPRAWEIITEVPALTIPRAGMLQVNYQMRGVAQPPASLLAATDAGVVAGMYVNGALVPGSEAMVVYESQAGGDQPRQVQATGSRQFMHLFAAGDVVQLGAYRLGADGIAQVVSNLDGRTSITAHWVAPEGDTAL